MSIINSVEPSDKSAQLSGHHLVQSTVGNFDSKNIRRSLFNHSWDATHWKTLGQPWENRRKIWVLWWFNAILWDLPSGND